MEWDVALSYLPRSSHTQRGEQSILSFLALPAEHALDELHRTCVLKQLSLPCMLFEYPGKREFLYSLLARVVRGRLDRDVRRFMALNVLDVEEAFAVDGRGWSQSEEDVEEGGVRS